MKNSHKDEFYMRLAIEISANGKYPFGAVVVIDDRIVGRSDDTEVMLPDAFAHAELAAIASASQASNGLEGATMYTSCEPCMMCMGAILNHGFGRLVYGCMLRDSRRYVFPELQMSAAALAEMSGIEMEVVPEYLRAEALAVMAGWVRE